MRCKIVWFLISADVKVEMFQDRSFPIFSLFSCSKLSWCNPFLPGPVFQVSFTHAKREDLYPRSSVSFFEFYSAAICKIEQTLVLPPVSSLLSSLTLFLALSLSLSSNTKIYLLHLLEATKRFRTVKSLRQKKFSHSAA